MVLRAEKRYTNGATNTTYVNDRHVDSHIAMVDAEDRDAGLVGEWVVTVRRVDGKLV